MKICGIKRCEDLLEIAKLGCDLVGFIIGFPKSPRNLELHEVCELISLTPEPLEPVVVCPASAQELIDEILDRTPPYAFQVYGDERPRTKGAKLIKAVRISEEFSVNDALAAAEGSDFLLLDSPSPGSGKVHNWEKSRQIRLSSQVPVILSGGLNPTNVREAIRVVAPYGVDVSSGVERSPGVKDLSKILEFIRAAKSY